jgi:hypothetical protein
MFHKHVAAENSPFLISEKFAEQTRNRLTNVHSEITKQTRMKSFVAFAYGISQLRSANSGILLYLRVGAVIQNPETLRTDFIHSSRPHCFSGTSTKMRPWPFKNHSTDCYRRSCLNYSVQVTIWTRTEDEFVHPVPTHAATWVYTLCRLESRSNIGPLNQNILAARKLAQVMRRTKM